jgi:hypothetical protein
VSEFFYISTVGVVKLALLLYYRRIFVFSLVSPGFRMMNNIMLGIVGAWMVAFYIATILQGRPISWNWTEVGTAINLHDFFIAEAATDITLDTIVLCMPTLVVYRMHMETRKKALVIAIFGLGFLYSFPLLFCYRMLLTRSQLHNHIGYPALLCDEIFQRLGCSRSGWIRKFVLHAKYRSLNS